MLFKIWMISTCIQKYSHLNDPFISSCQLSHLNLLSRCFWTFILLYNALGSLLYVNLRNRFSYQREDVLFFTVQQQH